MIQLNLRDSKPIYEQIRDSFIKLILCKAMKPDEKMPSVRSLASELSINPNTIQRAYNDLEAAGYIYSVSGKGSFVNDLAGKDLVHIKQIESQIRNLLGELRHLGVSEEELSSLLKEEK